MYSEAFNLLCEILDDQQLNDYIKEITGKNLTIINSGVQIDTPAARIALTGGDYTRSINTNGEVNFSVAFDMPLWNDNAFEQAVDFLDYVIPIFFSYGSGLNNKNIITRASPVIHEIDPEKDFWTITINLTIKILIS